MKERIEKIMKSEGMSASKFADAIGVQRSGISHILSGRNKPSLELVNKILKHFDKINADWLLLGKGEMVGAEEKLKESGSYTFESSNNGLGNTAHPVKIVILYSDNSFEEYTPK